MHDRSMLGIARHCAEAFVKHTLIVEDKFMLEQFLIF